jgi:Uma2 family endonuclease
MRLTLEEYLEMERRSEEKHEYVDGVVIDLSGTTLRHSRIALNTATRSSIWRCEVYSDVSVWIPPSRTCCYPDLFVICGAPRFKGERNDVVENPSVIIECYRNLHAATTTT